MHQHHREAIDLYMHWAWPSVPRNDYRITSRIQFTKTRNNFFNLISSGVYITGYGLTYLLLNIANGSHINPNSVAKLYLIWHLIQYCFLELVVL